MIKIWLVLDFSKISWSHYLDTDIKDFMRNYYRKQIGTLAFLAHTNRSNRAAVRFQKTVEDKDMHYDSFLKCAKAHSIYPCLRQRALDNKRFDMVFGLCFLPKQNVARVRTWGRYLHEDSNMYSFDITASMFERDNKDARIRATITPIHNSFQR